MGKIYQGLFLFMFLSKTMVFGQAPSWQWAQEANSNGTEYAWEISCDAASGNVYIGGTFNSNLSAKYGAQFTSTFGQDDGFLAKYTASGAFVWAIKIGGTGEDEVKGLSIDTTTGDIYICGLFEGTADFDPSGATFSLTSSGQKDGFLAKYSSTGVFIWATKFGGTGDDEPWKMNSNANGIYLTGSYASAPVTFNSYNNGTTKTTFSSNSNGEIFGAKYNSSGVIQWVISGGGSKVDCGYNVVADANAVYFIGRYDADITFRNATGVASAVLQEQQSNKQQVYIIAYDQSGNFVWQTNITSSQGGKDVVGWAITQDASNLYVSGYLEGDINFKWPTPTLTQNLTIGGGLDIYLAKLSKTGTFLWRTAVTGSGVGDQIGRALETDNNGNIILSGNFKNNLNYVIAGGPILTASATDIFISSYSNTGTFQWAAKAGNTNDDLVNGLSVDNSGGIYVTGEHANGAIFGTYSLTAGFSSSNIYLAKIGCVAPANNTVSASQTICAGNTPSTLVGSLPTGTGPFTFVWEQSLDNASWINATGTITNQNYSPPPLTVSTYYRRRVTVSGTCAAILNSVSVLISVDQIPTVSSAGTTQTICSSSATLNANNPSSGIGQWTVNSGTGTFSAANSYSSIVTGLSAGNNKFIWTISNGVCASSSSTVTVFQYISPTTSSAGTTQTLCVTTATLNANNPSVGVGQWSVVLGSGTVTSVNSYSSTITGLSTGSNNLVWTISNGVCPSSSSTVTLIRNNFPTVSNAGTTQTLCATSATLNANNPSVGIGQWSVISGTATVSAINSYSSGVAGLSLGLNKFVWTITNGVCSASSSTVTIQRDNNPSLSFAGNPQSVCASTTSINASAPTIGTGVWNVLSGSGTVSTVSNATTTVNGLSNGLNQFVWTVSNGVCPSSTSTLNVTRDLNPSVSIAGISQTLCTTSATLSANAPVVGIGQWSVSSGSSSLLSVSSPSTSANNISNGLNQYVWTVSNGVCPSSTSTVTVIKDIEPSFANAGLDQTICASFSSMNAVVPLIGTGTWSLVFGAGNINTINSTTTTITGLSAGQNKFVWSIANGVCPSSYDTIVVIRDMPGSIANAGVDQIICASTTSLNATAPLLGIGQWISLSGNTIINPMLENTVVNNIFIGNNTLVWTVANGVCPASRDTVLIKVDANPSIAFAGNDQRICTDSITVVATTPLIGTGVWQLISGNALINNITSNSAFVTSIPYGNTILRWLVSNGACPSVNDTLLIFRDQMPDTAKAGNDVLVESPVVTLKANTPLIGTGSWTRLSGEGIFENKFNSQTLVSDLSDGDNKFRWTIESGACPASYDDMIVNAKPFTVPNAFSPNGDGTNDFFVIPGLDYYEKVKFEVFNRWGSVIYASNDYKNDWMGQNMQNEQVTDDTYYYTLVTGLGKVYKGFLILKRTK